ncbi:biopolymer transporter ExbD [Geotalea sp. SG265]|uniref:ExbD/TolR family protein n=1 Tax=Geotalea sp. SG265 TaxID=2922867 RepID=UPI001FAF7F60|nr:biopolymer transporter ExbD [Geotalea sp. SG265]
MSDIKRLQRMARNNKKGDVKGLGINLIPMMDVLTVLVFFLLFHSFNGTLPDAKITLPSSVVEKKPRETVSLVITPEVVMVQGEPVINTTKVLDESAYGLRQRLEELRSSIEKTSKTPPDSMEVTILADKETPFKVIKRVMSTCTASGYGKISLAVVQKEHKKIAGLQ